MIDPLPTVIMGGVVWLLLLLLAGLSDRSRP